MQEKEAHQLSPKGNFLDNTNPSAENKVPTFACKKTNL